MKTKLSPLCRVSCFLCLLALCPLPSALSQIPQGFNYQAIARDGTTGNILAETDLTVQIAIRTAETGGTLIWQEEHDVTTDKYGIMSLIVGQGFRTGGDTLVFANIVWKAQPLYLETSIDDGGGMVLMGSTQIMSVPYSLVAKDVEGPVGKLGIKGTTEDNEEALFEVKNKDGQTIFAVYNEGVRIYVNDIDAKGVKGGFAIGGFGLSKTIPHEYLFISGDSVRFYIDNGDEDKGVKGGFAIGGFGTVKGLNQKYLTVSNDSVRIYIDNKDTDKGVKGGFAIGGYGAAKGKPQDLLTVSNEKVRIYLDEAGDDKGVKGGFAIGGYGVTKGGSNFLNVTPDSTRIYVSDATKTGSLGGFAVKPVTAASEKTDFFNVTSAPAAEVIKNESRIMWYPVKSALIGGEVHVGSADSVGQNSTALGYRSIAKGNQSQAFGYKSIAYGSYSTAIGFEAESNNNGMAVGYQAKASGNDAFALGSGALAIADNSFAFGSFGIDSLGNPTGSTQATGHFAFAFGLGSVASGRGAFAIGANVIASGDFSTSMGANTKAEGWYSTAMGAYSKATNSFAAALGYSTEASGSYSFTSGAGNKASGDGSIAMGYAATSSGSYSMAVGYGTYAQGWGSFAANLQNTSSGKGSSAFGDHNSSAGYYSLVTGTGNTAKSMNCVTIGSYCSDPGTDPDTYVATDPLFIAGNGTSPAAKNNALILYKDGNMTIMGNLTELSDIRFKNVISELGSVLPQVLEIEPILFEFKDTQSYPAGTHIGLSAQEIQKYFPELVFTDKEGYLSLDYSRLSVVLLKAIKEQQELIEKGKTRNDDLEDQIRDINLKLEQLIAKKAGE